MKGRIIDFSMSFGGKQRITLELDTDFREGYEALKDAVVEIVLRKWRARRSKSANAYFHLLVNEIAIAKGLSDDEVKKKLVVDYGTIARDKDGMILGMKFAPSVNIDEIYPYTRLYEQREEKGRIVNCYLVYKRSSWMDTKEFSHLIEGTIQVAQELNIDTDTPDRAGWWESLKGENNGNVNSKI